jgi:AAA+ ATPase superfamily predicted ATPase
MRFINREKELAVLRDHLQRPGASMFVLYGRRRIGKTALLEKAIDGFPRAAYHVGTRSTVKEEMARLSVTLARAWDVPLLEVQSLSSGEALMAFLQGVERPSILVLDELPYLIESDPALPGRLQAAWDQSLSRGQIKIVLCGSSVGIMRDTFFDSRSPLYGRRTGQLRLDPIAPHYLAEAFPWDSCAIVELAALFGGVPGYLQRLDPDDDLLGNLRKRVLQLGEPLYEEVTFLLREELREPRVYHAILASIAGGARKFGEISSKAGLDRSSLSSYLATLNDLGLIEREIPVTERRPEKSRKGLYRIADPFIATWFRFVHPFRDRLERGRGEEVMHNEVHPRIDHYLSMAVEQVLGELLMSSALAELVPFRAAAWGRYWSPTAELDLVLLDQARERAFIAEIKWTRSPIGASLLDQLQQRVQRGKIFAGMDLTYALISRAGFVGTTDRDDCVLIDISNLPDLCPDEHDDE